MWDIRVNEALLAEAGLIGKLLRPGTGLKVHWSSPITRPTPVATKVEFAYESPPTLRGSCSGTVCSYDQKHGVGHIRGEDDRLVFFQRHAFEGDHSRLMPGTKVTVRWKQRREIGRMAEVILLPV